MCGTAVFGCCSHLGLPDRCDLAMQPLDVLTDLIVLFTFSLAQVCTIEFLQGNTPRGLS